MWAQLVDPARVARWIGAEMRLVQVGRRGRHGAGTRCAVTLILPAGKLLMELEVEELAAASRLVYRVVAGLPLRRHRGEVTLQAKDGGTRLQWRVDAEYTVPLFEQLAHSHFEPRAEAGLAALARAIDEKRAARQLPAAGAEPPDPNRARFPLVPS